MKTFLTLLATIFILAYVADTYAQQPYSINNENRGMRGIDPRALKNYKGQTQNSSKEDALKDPRAPLPYKDPRNAAPSSAYEAQKAEKDRRESIAKNKVCDLSLSGACATVYGNDINRCDELESRCNTLSENDVDISCIAQNCELEKAECLVIASQKYQSCLASVLPLEMTTDSSPQAPEKQPSDDMSVK